MYNRLNKILIFLRNLLLENNIIVLKGRVPEVFDYKENILEKKMQGNLFDDVREEQLKTKAPLAVRMRPENLDEFFGQEHIVGEGKLLNRMIEADRISSIILFGPAGCGKTT